MPVKVLFSHCSLSILGERLLPYYSSRKKPPSVRTRLCESHFRSGSPSLNEDDPCLERIVLPVVRRTKLEVPVLVFGDDLESVLQWDIHVRSNSPLGVECRRRKLRFVPIVSNSGGYILIEHVANVGECTFAVELFQSRSRREVNQIDRYSVASVLESSLWQQVFPYWIGCI